MNEYEMMTVFHPRLNADETTAAISGLEEQMELEGRLIAACADSADGREGIEAFLTKRAPKFG